MDAFCTRLTFPIIINAHISGGDRTNPNQNKHTHVKRAKIADSNSHSCATTAWKSITLRIYRISVCIWVSVCVCASIHIAMHVIRSKFCCLIPFCLQFFSLFIFFWLALVGQSHSLQKFLALLLFAAESFPFAPSFPSNHPKTKAAAHTIQLFGDSN